MTVEKVFENSTFFKKNCETYAAQVRLKIKFAGKSREI